MVIKKSPKVTDSFGTNRDTLQKALEVVGDIREQQLSYLAQRQDFPPFVTTKLQKELDSLKQERGEWKRANAQKTVEK